MPTAIQFHDVRKHYRGARSYRALRDDLSAIPKRLIGRSRPPRGVVKALDGVSFDIEEGTSTALIGVNGAGKTTSLKIMTRITYPTEGVVRVRGRVGALIEVGTGMHPELTGRENIQLYGRILGLSRRDISDRFDEIVDFSGIGAAIDQPVKQYSSGMQLRIGFAVAAHLEPDVLLIDEAIAVGDAAFQYRCVERMSSLVREGRTLVFVSHDLSAIESLCSRSILIKEGKIVNDGATRDVVAGYLRSVHRERVEADIADRVVAGAGLEFTRVELLDRHGLPSREFEVGAPLTVRIHYATPRPVEEPVFTIGLVDPRFGPFTMASMLIDGETPSVIHGSSHIDCCFEHLPLRPKAYEIWGEVRGSTGSHLVDWQRLRFFEVVGEITDRGRGAVAHSMTYAPVKLPYRWHMPDEPAEDFTANGLVAELQS